MYQIDQAVTILPALCCTGPIGGLECKCYVQHLLETPRNPHPHPRHHLRHHHPLDSLGDMLCRLLQALEIFVHFSLLNIRMSHC